MDHLTSREDRKRRWYSTAWPRYVSVKIPKDKHAFEEEIPLGCDYVYSVPFHFLSPIIPRDHHHQQQQKEAKSIPSVLDTLLERDGFVVVSGVLTDQECTECIDLAWDWIEAASFAEMSMQNQEKERTERCLSSNDISSAPVSRDNPSSLYSSTYFPTSVEGGIQPFYGSGHSTFAWEIRSNPKVLRVFECLEQSNSLLSSLDGIVLWRGGEKNRTDVGWFHVDQNPRYKPGRQSVQGLVNLLPTTRNTGGNAISMRSHQHFERYNQLGGSKCASSTTISGSLSTELFYKTRLDEIGTDDWMEVDPGDGLILDPARIVTLLLQPGDMLLWDSRTAHCSYPGQDYSDTQQDDQSKCQGLIRAASLVSMVPSSQVSTNIMQARIESVHYARTLTHWPGKDAGLGNEREDEVLLEKERLAALKLWEKAKGKQVVLDWMDLDPAQKMLVARQ